MIQSQQGAPGSAKDSCQPSRRAEAARLGALRRSGLLDTAPEEAFDRLTRLAARLLEAPVALVSLVEDERQFFKSAVGLEGPLAETRETAREISFCRHVVEQRAPLVVNDARNHPVVGQQAPIPGLPVYAYLGVPIVAEGDHVIGSLCVIDHRPRTWTEENRRTLEDLAHIVDSEISLRRRERENRAVIASLRTSHERFSQLTENIREAFWVLSCAPERVTYVSPAYEWIWQRPAAALAENPRAWLEAVVPEDRARVEAAFAAAQQGKNGTIEYRIARPDGTERWIRARAFPIADHAGQVTGVCGLAEDVTAAHDVQQALQRETEKRRRAEKELLRAQRLESIGTLAAGLARDLNNMLSPILISAPMLRDEQPAAMRRELVGNIERSAERAAGILRQVLAFAQGHPGERRPTRPQALVEEVGRVISETFPRQIRIRPAADRELRHVEGDPAQLRQVLMNLCSNARDAMPDGGTLEITAENVEVDQAFAGMVMGARAGRYVRLRVTDTGTGIPLAILDRIFDPFFTTKAVGKGNGLGLSTVLGIVKGHDGFLDVRSAPGRGTTVEVYLPAPAAGGEKAAEEEPAKPAHGNGETILVVDDEGEARQAMATALGQHGYRTMTASDGAEALSIYARNTGEIRAILTDVAMPVVDGVALCRAVRKLNPTLPIIAATGLGEEARLREIQALNLAGVLNKPFGGEALLEMLNRSLAEANCAA